jgi:hypothetical protein
MLAVVKVVTSENRKKEIKGITFMLRFIVSNERLRAR